MSLCVESSALVFGKFEGVLEMHRFHPVDTVEYLTLITRNGVESHCNANGVLVDLEKKYSLMELNNGKSIG